MSSLTDIPSFATYQQTGNLVVGSGALPAISGAPGSVGTVLNNGCSNTNGAMVCPQGSAYNAGVFGGALAEIQNWVSGITSGANNAGLAPKSGATSSCSGWFCSITDWFKARGLDTVGGLVGFFIVLIAIYVLINSLSDGKLNDAVKTAAVA
jgi:hypothetical protein